MPKLWVYPMPLAAASWAAATMCGSIGQVWFADLETNDPGVGPPDHEVDDLADSGRRHSAGPTSQLHSGRDSSPNNARKRCARLPPLGDANERLFRRSLGLPGDAVNRRHGRPLGLIGGL